jgi:hypothetical protein
MIAVMLSFVENCGDNAKTDAILKTNEATDKWGYYQAKSVKSQITGMHASLLKNMNSANPDAVAAQVGELERKENDYKGEMTTIKGEAEKFTEVAKLKSDVNDRCDESALFLQIAVVMCSVSILAHQRALWYVGIALAVTGAFVGFQALTM